MPIPYRVSYYRDTRRPGYVMQEQKETTNGKQDKCCAVAGKRR